MLIFTGVWTTFYSCRMPCGCSMLTIASRMTLKTSTGFGSQSWGWWKIMGIRQLRCGGKKGCGYSILSTSLQWTAVSCVFIFFPFSISCFWIKTSICLVKTRLWVKDMDICETILPLIFLALVFNCSIQTFESPGWKEVPFSEILNSFWIKTRHKKAAYPSNFPLFSRFNFEMSIQKKLPYDYGGFQKWWYPQIIHFNRDFRDFHYKPSILGYLNFWKHPYLCMLEILILRWRFAGTSWHLWLPNWTRTTISFHLIFFESQLKLDGPRFR